MDNITFNFQLYHGKNKYFDEMMMFALYQTNSLVEFL
jgi:hypothetical protein